MLVFAKHNMQWVSNNVVQKVFYYSDDDRWNVLSNIYRVYKKTKLHVVSFSFNPFQTQEMHFLQKEFKIFLTAARVCKIVLVKILTKFQSILYRILCSFKRRQNQFLVFEIWLLEKQSLNGPSSGL